MKNNADDTTTDLKQETESFTSSVGASVW